MWDTKFWLKRDWPVEGQTDAFLGRAFDRVGMTMFGWEWLGTEVMTELSDPFPDVITPKSENYQRFEGIARKILNIHDMELTPDDWQEARRQYKANNFTREVAIRRRHAVCQTIILGCQSGALHARYRPVQGGEFAPIPSIWWNTERNSQRFVRCQINPTEPYSTGFAGDGFCWIFLTDETLHQYLTKPPSEAAAKSGPNTKSDVHLSPYLRVMLKVAEKLQITPENQPKKVVVEAALREEWTLPEPLSANMLEAMATALREPGSQLGRAAKPDNKKK